MFKFVTVLLAIFACASARPGLASLGHHSVIGGVIGAPLAYAARGHGLTSAAVIPKVVAPKVFAAPLAYSAPVTYAAAPAIHKVISPAAVAAPLAYAAIPAIHKIVAPTALAAPLAYSSLAYSPVSTINKVVAPVGHLPLAYSGASVHKVIAPISYVAPHGATVYAHGYGGHLAAPYAASYAW